MSGILAALEVEESIALEVFKEGNKELLEELQDDENDKNLSRLKLEAEYKVGATKCSIKTQRDHAMEEARTMCKRAEDLFGANEWAEFPTLKQQVEEAKQKSEGLTNDIKPYDDKLNAMGEQMKSLTRAKTVKKLLEEIIVVKTDATNLVQNLKKEILAIKVVLKRKEREESKTVILESNDDGPKAESGATAMSLVQALEASVCPDPPLVANCVTDFNNLVRATENRVAFQKPVVLRAIAEDPKALIGQCTVAVAMNKWMTGQLHEKKEIQGVVDKPEYMQVLKKKINEIVGDTENRLFKQLVSVSNPEVIKKVFQMLLLKNKGCKGEAGSCQLAPCGLAQCQFVLEGSIMVYGVHLDSLGGFTLKTKQDAFNNMPPEVFSAHVSQEEGFAAKLGPGDLILLPTGYLYSLVNTASENMIVRWLYCDEACEGEYQRCLSSAMLLIAQNPELNQGDFQRIVAILQERGAAQAKTR